MRDGETTERGIEACRNALHEQGLLLVQDAWLPSVATIVAGEPNHGSWWAHELAHSIFAVIETLEPDVAVVKLVAKKQTLVHRRLWPALIGTGRARSRWQMVGLSNSASEALDLIDRADAPVRADELGLSTKPALVVRELELRLLVMTSDVHTESGRHVKAAAGWTGGRRPPASHRSTLPRRTTRSPSSRTRCARSATSDGPHCSPGLPLVRSGHRCETPVMATPGSLVRAYTEAWLAGDLITLLGLYHDDLVLHYGGSNPLSGDHHGKDAALTTLLAVQERTQRVPVAVIDVLEGGDHAAAWVRERWTVDGVETELTRVLVYRIADDQLAECWIYDNDQALVDRALAD